MVFKIWHQKYSNQKKRKKKAVDKLDFTKIKNLPFKGHQQESEKTV